MLALAYAAEHVRTVAGLALIGCGTFDEKARTELDRRLEKRIEAETRARLDGLEEKVPDPNQRLRETAELLLPYYCHDPETLELENDVVDAQAHAETWADMLRLQGAGVYPREFWRITTPVLMLHGVQDPHPGRLIRESLARFIPHLEYREWKACGHYPWLERSVKNEFFAVLQDWLAETGRTSATANVT
jgi:pimeloyl-ACP methyl ester carboxylesterase